jgi:hypothetical protein
MKMHEFNYKDVLKEENTSLKLKIDAIESHIQSLVKIITSRAENLEAQNERD